MGVVVVDVEEGERRWERLRRAGEEGWDGFGLRGKRWVISQIRPKNFIRQKRRNQIII